MTKVGEMDATKEVQIDPQRLVEDSIMRLKGFDYASASDLFAAFQMKLVRVYGEHLNADVSTAMKYLSSALDRAYGNGG